MPRQEVNLFLVIIVLSSSSHYLRHLHLRANRKSADISAYHNLRLRAERLRRAAFLSPLHTAASKKLVRYDHVFGTGP